MIEPFDEIAEAYARWYDEPEGYAILEAELACLRRIAGGFNGRWLEVGVGTDRFVSNLGIGEEIDPFDGMLALTAARGIRITPTRSESRSKAMAICFSLHAKSVSFRAATVRRG